MRRMNGIGPSDADLVIYGAGGMGQEVADLALSTGRQVVGFIDDRQDLIGQLVLGVLVLGDRSWLAGRQVEVCVAIGAPAGRRRASVGLKDLGVVQASALVHPTAHVGLGCSVGPGSVVSAGATL